ncbi:GerAB/ArcD/ProY family transporter [Cohnella boryungensis]|uniref:Endospore germination permease n=1 Tax=Cohnella boryungensis TaxID=768479 RepID=A0ABV8SFE3_9BACL
MTRQANITVKQMKVIITFFLLGDIMWFLPTTTTAVVQEDAWISAMIGIVIGIGLASLIFLFASKFRGLSLIHINRKVLGKYVGGVFSLFFLYLVFNNASAQVRVIGEFITVQMMTETPMRVIMFFFSAVVMIAVYTGYSVIARAAQVFYLLFVVMFSIFIVLLFPEVTSSNLQPILNHTPGKLFGGALLVIAFPFCQLTTLLMLFPYVENKRGAIKEYLYSTVLSGIAILLVILMSILVLGSYMTANHFYATYTLAKKINIGNFLQRLEVILVISYLTSTFYKCAITLHIVCRGLQQLFGLREYRTLVVPMFLMVFGYAYVLTPNTVVFNSLSPPWAFWEISNVLLQVFVVYSVYWLRTRWRKSPI